VRRYHTTGKPHHHKKRHTTGKKKLFMEPVSAPALLRQVGKTPRQTQPATRPGAQKQLQPANRSHMITHQQTSPMLPQTRSRYIPPTPSTQ